jgi:hypothetical protein
MEAKGKQRIRFGRDRGYVGFSWAVVFLLVLAACFTPVHPSVSLEPGVSLTGYHVFLVAPVHDATHAPFDLNVTDTLRQEIVDRLQYHGLQVTPQGVDTADDLLLITSTLVFFRGMSNQMELPGPGGQEDIECRLQAELRDPRTGKHLGDIVSSDLGGRTPLIVLNECAHDLADAIYRLQHGQ